MDASEILRSQAERLALRAEQRALKLQAELLEIEAKKLAIEAELDLSKGAVKRLINFEIGRGVNRQCPFCWVENGIRSTLDGSIPSPSTHTILRCDTCNNQWDIPSGRE
jgi:hypothetical protein